MASRAETGGGDREYRIEPQHMSVVRRRDRLVLESGRAIAEREARSVDCHDRVGCCVRDPASSGRTQEADDAEVALLVGRDGDGRAARGDRPSAILGVVRDRCVSKCLHDCRGLRQDRSGTDGEENDDA